MRAFTKIAVATAVAGGLSIAGSGAALAEPPPEDAAVDAVEGVESAESGVEGVESAGETAGETADELSPEALALLEDEDVVALLSDPAVVELLGDEDALAVIAELAAMEDPLGALDAVELPEAPAELPDAELPDAPVEAPEAPVGGVDDVTGALP
ncbi:hypothetical protein DFP74_0226 [Nocardiopsis sp. Huas11]|uniref:hypothetical protein n=1 Tax=Nocardiopsis sp. Huas11 TaxID=2183912 RepID=UPI000EB19E62|nr:hypothetical protein [Nocardiopsis sp. Huas11]RKS04666.1 hypothetical protein DFP74_0226 [Nocardiopsis sp. Huas11]